MQAAAQRPRKRLRYGKLGPQWPGRTFPGRTSAHSPQTAAKKTLTCYEPLLTGCKQIHVYRLISSHSLRRLSLSGPCRERGRRRPALVSSWDFLGISGQWGRIAFAIRRSRTSYSLRREARAPCGSSPWWSFWSCNRNCPLLSSCQAERVRQAVLERKKQESVEENKKAEAELRRKALRLRAARGDLKLA